MMQDLKGQVPSNIDLRNEDELRWWAKELGVTEDQVRGAVSSVGSSAEVVRRFLQHTPSTSADDLGGRSRSQHE